jgi:1-acyl-sn-glycerol-3-phosphate acyltransferase
MPSPARRRFGIIQDCLKAFGIAVVTILTVFMQAVAVIAHPRVSRWIPVFYCRLICKLIGVRTNTFGSRTNSRPTLILANHVSWLDIFLVNATGPTMFVAKSEIQGWPLFGWMARLQKSIFVNRRHLRCLPAVNHQIAQSILAGNVVAIFPEGTTSDGRGLLPFTSGLLGSAKDADSRVYVQPLAIIYLGKDRDRVAWPWYEDISFLSHLWRVIRIRAIHAELRWMEAVVVDRLANRKDVTRHVEASVHDVIYGSRSSAEVVGSGHSDHQVEQT